MSARRLSIIVVSTLLVACGRSPPAPPQATPTEAGAPAPQASDGWLEELASTQGAAPEFAQGEDGAASLISEAAAQTDSLYGQPGEERVAQQKLPQAPDALWRTLATTRIQEDLERGVFTASHSAEVRALAGRTLTLSGFVMPLEAEPRFRHFLLSRYTPVCDFCPPGGPNEVVEVWSERPIAPTYALMRVTGRFSLTNNGEKGLFFRLDGADVQAAGAARR
jgi:hypothetical protein